MLIAKKLSLKLLIPFAFGLGMTACVDRAEAPLKECERLKAEAKITEALKACEQAVAADPKGKSGVAAASLLGTLKGSSGTPCSCPPGDPLCSCAGREPAGTSSAAAPSETKPKLDPAAAIDLCKKGGRSACSAACDVGDLPSCVTFAEGLLAGSDRDAKKACEAPLRKACDGKVGRGCSALARCLDVVILADGRKTYLKDKREKAALNEQACTFNDGLGCFSSAKNYEEGYGVEQDDAKSAALMNKALTLMPKQCDSGDGKSCLSLAMLYSPASASARVQKSEAKSKALYQQACDAGEEVACNLVKAGAK
jgi:hypothetical protein